MRFGILLAAILISLVLSIYKHESRYKVGACVNFGREILTIVEETADSYVLANEHIRIMDKKYIIRRYYGVTTCKK